MMMRLVLGLACMLALGAGSLRAESAVGVWRTQADDKGQRAIVTSKPCGGDALCGTITAVLDPAGNRIDHPNIGVRLFWDMLETGDGTYQGMAFVPAMKARTKATMQVFGRKMTVRGCIGPVCKSQVWTRVK